MKKRMNKKEILLLLVIFIVCFISFEIFEGKRIEFFVLSFILMVLENVLIIMNS